MSTERNNQLIEQVVTRFDQDMDGSMEPEESGEWVRFECIEKLIELIRSDEREACAKVCDDATKAIFELHDEIVKETARNVCTNLAKGIRARGNE